MNRLHNPRAHAVLRDIIFSKSETQDDVCKVLNTLPLVNPKSLPLIQPYVSQWSIRAIANIRKKPTEEEKALEKMIFECLWDMKVITEEKNEAV